MIKTWAQLSTQERYALNYIHHVGEQYKNSKMENLGPKDFKEMQKSIEADDFLLSRGIKAHDYNVKEKAHVLELMEDWQREKMSHWYE